MTNILIIDDDINIGNALEETLRQNGYGVIRAYSGTEAALLLAERSPDLVLLDLMLPGLSGEELLPRIKDIPVIVLSAKADVDSKVDLLLGGAADYVTKPFHSAELLARISAQLRAFSGKSRRLMESGGISLDTESGEVRVNEKPVKLTRTEYAILKILMRNSSRIVSKSTILNEIFDDTPDCTESSLKTHVSHLRSKLTAAGGREYIETVWGIGFRLI